MSVRREEQPLFFFFFLYFVTRKALYDHWTRFHFKLISKLHFWLFNWLG